jgi:hypothetical protein
MAFDNPDFGRKNYEEYLRAAKETLGVEHLTDDDRWIIERGIYYLVQGNDLLKREDPESLREAAWLFLAGAYYLGSRCAVSISEKKYWDLKSHGPGGKKGSKTRQRKMRDWHDHARALQAEIRRNNPTLKPDALATSILEKWEATVPAPEHETLTKFIRAELKSIAAQKGPRLVHE